MGWLSLLLAALACNGTETPTEPGTGGNPPGSGGNSTSGGVSPGTGGAPTGGKATGGGNAGGTATGGKASGGTSSGGSTTGGANAGGSAASSLGCKFIWSEADPSGSLTSYTWLQGVSVWAGYEIQKSGSITSCSNCSSGGFLSRVAATSLIPIYYAYIIGYWGHANNLPDANQVASGAPSLATGMGALLLGTANTGCPSGQFCSSNLIVQAYAYYAQQTHAAWPTKPLLWLLEGDFVQYATNTQTQPLTMTQLGQLAALITTAIKTNMPNAVVAIDHSTWNTDDVTNSFWAAMAQANYDLVWTTGIANNGDFLSSGTTSSSYNGATAKYSYLHSLTGKKIFVDQWSPDTWSNQSAATINTLISHGVIGLNANSSVSNYQSNATALSPQLSSTCP